MRHVRFQPFVFDRQSEQVPVTIAPMTQPNAELTDREVPRQTSWTSATPKERQFIEEVTRVTYERERAQRLGTPLSEARPSFAS